MTTPSIRSGILAMGVAAIAGLASCPTAATAQSRTLTIATHYTDEQMKPLTACFRQYEAENAGVTVQFRQSTYADFLQTILTARLGGTPPDIYNLYSIWGAQLTGSGVLAPPPAEIQEFVKANYAANTQQAATVGGKLWGVPSEVSVYMLIYNKKLFAAAGIEKPPSTPDELVAAARKIAKSDEQGTLRVAGYAFGPTVANAIAPLRTLVLGAGDTLFTPDGKGTNLVKPEVETALASQVALFRDKSTSNGFAVGDFPSGSVGMMIHANWFKDTLKSGFGPAFAETVGVAPIPAGPDWKTYQYAFFYGVDARSRNKEEAWRFIRWLNTPRADKPSCTGEMLAKLGALTGNTGDLKALRAEYGDSFTQPFVDALSSGRAVAEVNVPRASESERALAGALRDAWSGKLTPGEALARADKEIRAALEDAN